MSVKAVSWVFDHSPYTLGARLVHLAIADVANEDNDWQVWVSHSRIAEKAKVSRGTVVTTIKKMLADGALELVEEQKGSPSTYRMVGCTKSVMGCAKSDTPTCAIDGPEPARLTKPHLLPTKEERKGSRRRPETPFPEGKFFITEDMTNWIETNDLGYLDVRMETANFKDHALANDRRARDWVAAWRTWMRRAGTYMPKPSDSGTVVNSEVEISEENYL